MLVVPNLPSVQGHPQPDPLGFRVHIIVVAQRGHERRWQRLHEQALRYIRSNQDEHAIAAVLMITVSPWDTCPAECLLHCLVQTVTDSHLIPVSPATISERLDIDRNDGSVNGRALTLHPPSPRDQSRAARSKKAYLRLRRAGQHDIHAGLG